MMPSKVRDLDQWLNYIEQSHPLTISMGLERVKKVSERRNLHQFPFPVVIVGGTNGKGSTVSSLAKLLQTAGLRVGTYSSPHLLDFKERIQINGCFLNESELCEAFAEIEQLREETLLTFFEFTTLAAFYLFQQPQFELDIVILEVGLGGRLDAVNIVSPNIAVITSIGYDHQEYLGNTLESIAYEKAGILRPKIPVIFGKQAKNEVLLEQAAKHSNPVYIEGEHFDYEPTGSIWSFCGLDNLVPRFYLPTNSVSLAMAAYTILSEIHFSLPPLKSVVKCFEDLMMVGRFHPVIINNIPIIFDVGHNPDGSLWLAKKLQGLNPKRKILAVWASLEDKALSEIVAPMKHIVDSWFIGELPEVKRSAAIDKLAEALSQQKIQAVYPYPTILDAFIGAMKMVNEDDLIVVFGSFYTVSQVMKRFLNIELQNNGLFYAVPNNPRANSFAISGH